VVEDGDGGIFKKKNADSELTLCHYLRIENAEGYVLIAVYLFIYLYAFLFA